MTAEEARQLTIDSQPKSQENVTEFIFDLIKESAKDGRFNCAIPVDKLMHEHRNLKSLIEYIKVFRERGFNVTILTDNKNDIPFAIRISWNKL